MDYWRRKYFLYKWRSKYRHPKILDVSVSDMGMLGTILSFACALVCEKEIFYLFIYF